MGKSGKSSRCNNKNDGTDGCSPKVCNDGMCSTVKDRFSM